MSRGVNLPNPRDEQWLRILKRHQHAFKNESDEEVRACLRDGEFSEAIIDQFLADRERAA